MHVWVIQNTNPGLGIGSTAAFMSPTLNTNEASLTFCGQELHCKQPKIGNFGYIEAFNEAFTNAGFSHFGVPFQQVYIIGSSAQSSLSIASVVDPSYTTDLYTWQALGKSVEITSTSKLVDFVMRIFFCDYDANTGSIIVHKDGTSFTRVDGVRNYAYNGWGGYDEIATNSLGHIYDLPFTKDVLNLYNHRRDEVLKSTIVKRIMDSTVATFDEIYEQILNDFKSILPSYKVEQLKKNKNYFLRLLDFRSRNICGLIDQALNNA